MKILHLIYTNGIAGAEKYLQHLLPAMQQTGISSHIIIVCERGAEKMMEEYKNSFVEKNIPVLLMSSGRRGFPKTAYRIADYLKKNNISIIHSHLLNSDVLATLVKMFFKRDVVIISTKHGYKESIQKYMSDAFPVQKRKMIAKKGFYYYVSRITMKWADHNYAVSRAIANLYYELKLTDELMPHIYHGVNVPPQYPNGKEGYRIAEKQIITVGRLEEVKGHSYLLKAMPEVIKAFPDCKLLILGDGADRQKLEALTAELGIGANVDFMGFTSNPYPYMTHSDMAIFTSFFESFGLVYIEAFALQTPVVAFDTPAGNEIMENNVTALLVPVKDSGSLAKNIISIFRDPEMARQMADRAYQKYKEFFSTERMAQETSNYYRSLKKLHPHL